MVKGVNFVMYILPRENNWIKNKHGVYLLYKILLGHPAK